MHNRHQSNIKLCVLCIIDVIFVCLGCIAVTKKGGVGKSREELALEKKRELERRLQDVSGQLNSSKKPPKTKGMDQRST